MLPEIRSSSCVVAVAGAGGGEAGCESKVAALHMLPADVVRAVLHAAAAVDSGAIPALRSTCRDLRAAIDAWVSVRWRLLSTCP